MRLIFDIETDGLLDKVSKIHCIVAKDVDTKEVHQFTPDTIEEGIRFLCTADELIAHHGYWYDFVVLERLYPELFIYTGKRIDTFVDASLIWSHIAETDIVRVRSGKLPPKLRGSQSLKAWGYRLGILKGDFGTTTDWSEYSEEMLGYCVQDVEVTDALFTSIEKQNYSQKARELEYSVGLLMAKQESNGFVFDKEAAVTLYSSLVTEKENISNELIRVFGCWYRNEGEQVSKRTLNYKDPMKASKIKDVPYTEVKFVEFNPGSRAHIAERLKTLYGWVATDFTLSGLPKIDEEVLKHLDNPHAKAFSKFLKINKILGQLGEGANAWLEKVTTANKIHHHVNTNKAATGRATHTNPNLAQVPKVSKNKAGEVLKGLDGNWGWESRSLFTVPSGWVLFGSDASGLELRCLAHMMAAYDDGAYIDTVLNGDIHTANQLAAGLPTRNDAKTFILN